MLKSGEKALLCVRNGSNGLFVASRAEAPSPSPAIHGLISLIPTHTPKMFSLVAIALNYPTRVFFRWYSLQH